MNVDDSYRTRMMLPNISCNKAIVFIFSPSFKPKAKFLSIFHSLTLFASFNKRYAVRLRLVVESRMSVSYHIGLVN